MTKNKTTNSFKPVNKVTNRKNAIAKRTVQVNTQAAPVEVSPELQAYVAAQLTDRRFAPIKYDELTKSVTYVTASNGLFKATKTPIGLFKECLQEFDAPVVGLPEMEAGVELVIPKIPFKYIIQALSFYRDVNTNDKTEASLLFFWNHNNIELDWTLPGLSQDGQLVIYCPEQVNSSTLSDFTDDEYVDVLRQNCALLLETHSH